jgi:hypothetical protein
MWCRLLRPDSRGMSNRRSGAIEVSAGAAWTTAVAPVAVAADRAAVRSPVLMR